MKSFYIGGAICGSDADKCDAQDVAPAQIISWMKGLQDGEPFEVQINSPGGDVFAGLQIYNSLRAASKAGHRVTTHCTSLAASIASIIFMAGDELVMDQNSVLMLHLPWSCVQGNAVDMMKEVGVLEKIAGQMVQIYATKFKLSEETIRKMLEDETWLTSNEVGEYYLDCTVAPSEASRIAAKIVERFNIPAYIRNMMMEETHEETIELSAVEAEAKADIEAQVEAQLSAETPEEPVETPVEKPVEEKAEEPVEKPVEEKAEETVPKAEVEKRVSGMQASMQKQLNAMKADYEARLNDFTNQLKAKDEELTAANAKVTSLGEQLEKSACELRDAVSALAERENALATLNANVNTPAEIAVDWRNLKGAEFFAWYEKNASKQIKR